MRTRKGISPLIATVILVAFVVAIAGIAATFFTGFAREQTVDARTQGQETVDCGNAAIKIRNVTSDGTHSYVEVQKLGSYDFTNVDLSYRTSATSATTTFNADLRLNDTNSITSINLSSVASTYEVTAFSECPGISSTLRNDSGTWSEVF